VDKNQFEQKFAEIDSWGQSLTNELSKFITTSPAEFIYHYTNANGLLGIVSSGRVWATHVSRLNDKSENIYGFELVKNFTERNRQYLSRALLEKVSTELCAVDTYVACYSEIINLLSQWRSYGGSSVGYCLGFETKRMATVDGRMPLLEKVIYGDGKAIALLDYLMQQINCYLNSKKFGQVEVGYQIGMLAATLNNIACIIKHPSFEEEGEYRQIYQPKNSKRKLQQYTRSGQYGLTPYVKIDFPEDDLLPLETITIGPCEDFNKEEKMLKELLSQNRYKNVEILRSIIPLRT